MYSTAAADAATVTAAAYTAAEAALQYLQGAGIRTRHNENRAIVYRHKTAGKIEKSDNLEIK